MRKLAWLLLPLAAAALAAPAGAQQSGAGIRLLNLTPDNATNLAGTLAATAYDAVSVDCSRAELDGVPGATQALVNWVAAGGVVFLHTDAARIFGYSTVAARAGTSRQAGQLFGRARAALPFAAHPLLWGGARTGRDLEAAAMNAGVQLVFYQMAPDDHLVTQHPQGVPLLRVTDLAAPASGQQLIAAAVAPYGRGWAVFTPRVVETHRGDGNQFLAGLVRLAAQGQDGGREFVGIPASALRAATASQDSAAGYATLNAALAKILQSPTAAAAVTSTQPAAATTAATGAQPPVQEAVLMVPRTAAQALQGMLAGNNAGAVLALWRAQINLQANDLTSAGKWLQMAADAAPQAAEVALWQANLAAAQAADLTLSSGDRAVLMNQAAGAWQAALNGQPLLAVRGGQDIGGVPRTAVRTWANAAANAARLMAAEPPVVTVLGSASSAAVLRSYANDPSLRLALPAGQQLPQTSNVVGWRADHEEILIFPTPEEYVAYRAAAGVGNQAVPNPAGQYGDAVGSRMLMMSQFTLPIILPPQAPGQQVRILQFGTAVPAVMARLQAYILTNALAEGGTTVPDWLQLGLARLINLRVIAVLGNAGTPGGLAQSDARAVLAQEGAPNRVLAPGQFGPASANQNTSGLAEAEAEELVRYFYQRFGMGSVVETLQRLGSGQSADQAMVATTGLTERQFINQWARQEFNG